METCRIHGGFLEAPACRPEKCGCGSKLAVVPHRGLKEWEWCIVHFMEWGPGCIREAARYLGTIVTSCEAWGEMPSDVTEWRITLNYEGPILKMEKRVGLFSRAGLSIAARGLVWNTYIATLCSFVA